MKTYRISRFTLFTLAALGIMPAQSAAQEQADETQEPLMEEVVVRGYRLSIQNSLDAKRNADTIIESISAADIGGLPDVSIADALGRLPGITFDREGGQASTVQLRGMGSPFVMSTLNGREQVSTSTRGKREINFSQYPSELLSNVSVYKTPKASLIEGGVAGSVDLRLADPLDMSQQQKIFTSIRGAYNDSAGAVHGADELGTRTTISYQGKFFDDRLGLLLGYAGLDQSNAVTEVVGLSYSGTLRRLDGRQIDNTAFQTLSPADQQRVKSFRLTEGFELQHNGGTDKRDGYVAGLTIRPNDYFTAKMDYFYSDFTTDTFANGYRINSFVNGEVYNSRVRGDTVIGGTVTTNPAAPTALNFQVINDDSSFTSDLESYGLNLAWEEEIWSLSADYSHSKSNATETDGISRSHLYRQNAGTGKWERESDLQLSWLNDGLKIPRIAFNRDFTDLSKLRLTSYELYPHIGSDESEAIRVDFEYELPLPVFSSVEAGYRQSERQYAGRRETFVYNADDTSSSDRSLAISAANAALVNWRGAFSHLPPFVAVNSQAIFQQARADGLVLGKDGQPRNTAPAARWNENRDWSMTDRPNVNEEVAAYYVQFNIDTAIGNIPVTGNAGVRVIETDQSSYGIIAAVNSQDPLQSGQPIRDDLGRLSKEVAYVIESGADSYRHTLPSLNLNFQITEKDYIRIAYATVIARPDMSQLAYANNSQIDCVAGDCKTGSAFYSVSRASNPFLRPFEADQIDISYERYFDDIDGALTIALFNKDIKNRIQTVTFRNFFANGGPYKALGIIRPDTHLSEIDGFPVEIPVDRGDYTLAINNDKGGYIRGAEIAFTGSFKFLPEPYDGLGMTASYAHVASEITTPSPFSNEPGKTIPFEGLSPDSANITLFYVLNGFETRLSGGYQSHRIGSEVGIDAVQTYRASSVVWDYQASYTFDNGLDVVFSINNLTDEPDINYFGIRDATGTIGLYGRQYYFGVNYSL